MSSFINEFKKMVDISEEGELLQKEVDELKCTEGGGDGDVVGDSSELFEVMLKRAEQKLQKKDEDYQRLLAETHTLRIEYDDYKRKSDQELKTLRRSLTQEQHAIKVYKLMIYYYYYNFRMHYVLNSINKKKKKNRN